MISAIQLEQVGFLSLISFTAPIAGAYNLLNIRNTGDVVLPMSLGHALMDAGVVSGFIFHSPVNSNGGG
ncbi:hypothetical protein [Pseudoalteromonas luteoviolacea]|uniref:Uncharacterized protein n=1 Tax=Pseudoalteromonas luteoviolacea S4054 TaxID=1129367 RepID=A0A0F6A6T8_9GAMM|nr:hypothetical protein [Pseudoalteromonas luteoviolacea]KKE81927.1 hypothetical protein N479_20745 [Pseudoalteromonas luteoviolacea S4054]KZN71094.1 hypothetical protein N481_19640 [Pseudoalteromonas luteoviolacea S4047-1]AOT11066.1 hypothetical protein S4054249_24850 [Pseudoalteromonas luteoviolacea]AOT15770.1 hypothetical protein S40542_23660 [Pseudoalteromonas luteoviolacea]AOT20887.1 hypothetical protein S4054_24770 [Pseudoalteromonas luteoviolacea]